MYQLSDYLTNDALEKTLGTSLHHFSYYIPPLALDNRKNTNNKITSDALQSTFKNQIHLEQKLGIHPNATNTCKPFYVAGLVNRCNYFAIKLTRNGPAIELVEVNDQDRWTHGGHRSQGTLFLRWQPRNSFKHFFKRILNDPIFRSHFKDIEMRFEGLSYDFDIMIDDLTLDEHDLMEIINYIETTTSKDSSSLSPPEPHVSDWTNYDDCSIVFTDKMDPPNKFFLQFSNYRQINQTSSIILTTIVSSDLLGSLSTSFGSSAFAATLLKYSVEEKIDVFSFAYA